MKQKTKELVEQIGTDTSGKWISHDRLDDLVKLVVNECVDAIETINKGQARTTYDLDLVESTMARCVDNVKARFE